MISEAIQTIARLAQDAAAKGREPPAERVERGITYAWTGTRWESVPRPAVQTLVLSTLGGLVEWLGNHGDMKRDIVCVRDPRVVDVVRDHATVTSESVARAMVDARAIAEEGRTDAMIIQLLTKFGNTPDRERLLHTLGTVESSTVVTSKDDGVSQVVQVRKGIKPTTETLSPLFDLQPLDTFSEVEAPITSYLLRLNGREGGETHVRLIPADPEGHKRMVVEGVANYLRKRLGAWEVYA